MYHFFVDTENILEQTVQITGPDVHHIGQVLRLRAGEEILISSLAGGDIRCAISRVEKNIVMADILERLEENRELPARIRLYQGLPKSDKLEWIIQKAVELGAAEIIPVSTKFAVVKPDPGKEKSRTGRRNAIALAAAKQSKRSVVPVVTETVSFREALRQAQSCDLRIMPYENAEGMKGTGKILSKALPGREIAVLIGPEGGFAPEEVQEAREAGFLPVSLGRRILRTETAGLCVLSALMLQLEVRMEDGSIF